MKQTTNFPYNVDVHTIHLKELPQNSDSFEYEVVLPDYYAKDNKFIDFKKNIDLIAETNCSATMYRKVFSVNTDSELIISIPRNKVHINFNILSQSSWVTTFLVPLHIQYFGAY